MLMEMWGVGLAWGQINSLAKRFARVKGWEGGGEVYKQVVYKQLTLAWKIAKQLSGLNPLSLSNNKIY